MAISLAVPTSLYQRSKMRLISLWFISLFAVTSLPSSYAGIDERSTAEAMDVVDLFRDVFYSLARSHYGDDEIRKMVLYPHRAIMQPLAIQDPADPFAAKRQLLRKVSPQALFENSLDTEFRAVEGLRAWARERGPVTIVALPGLLGEFIERIPFAEVVNGPSQLAGEWQEALAGLSEEERRVPAFSIKNFDETAVSLEEVFRVGSIDDDEGQALVRYIYLRPPFGSFETLGSLDVKMAYYKERLSRIFALLGFPAGFYLLGYSQGANVALQMASELATSAGRAAYPWAGDLRGVISLGGALFGAELTDMLEDPREPDSAVAAEIRAMAESLEDSFSSLTDIPHVIYRNARLWKATFQRIHKLTAGQKQANASALASEGIEVSSVKAFGLVGLLTGVIGRHFTLTEALTGYFKNIRRLKLFAAGVSEATAALAAKARFDWWKTHTLSPELNYLAITATMASAYRPEMPEPLRRSVFFGPDSKDYAFLRAGFYDIYRRTGLDLNDSQVTVHQAMFWPELHRELNPAQLPYRAHNLGIVGTHHWGLALTAVIDSDAGPFNPFPRQTLLEALAYTAVRLEP